MKITLLREPLFSRLYGVWYCPIALFVAISNSGQPEHAAGVNRLNCKKSGASYQNGNHCHFKEKVRKGIAIPSANGCHFLSFSILYLRNALAITAPDTVRRRRFYLTSCYRNGDLSKRWSLYIKEKIIFHIKMKFIFNFPIKVSTGRFLSKAACAYLWSKGLS